MRDELRLWYYLIKKNLLLAAIFRKKCVQLPVSVRGRSANLDKKRIIEVYKTSFTLSVSNSLLDKRQTQCLLFPNCSM